MAGFEISKSSSKGEVRDPGTGIGGGLLNFIFGQEQNLNQGQFVAGAPGQVGPDGRPIRGGNVPAGFQQFAGMLENILGRINPFSGQFGEATQGIAGQQRGLFDRSAEALQGLISTGSPVDTSAIAQSGLTDIKEQFSGLGGLFGNDIQSEALRLGSELNVSAQEAARQRQLQAIGLGQGLGAAQTQFATGLLNAGGLFEQTSTLGGRQLNLFNNLFGQQSTNPFSAGTDTSTKQKGFGISGL